MLSAGSPSRSRRASCARIYTREGRFAAKKHAKVRHFFDIRKFFSKKIAFLCIFLNYGIFRKTANTTTLIAIDLI